MKDFLKYVLATVVGLLVAGIIGFFLFFLMISVLVSSTEKTISVSNNSLLVLKFEGEIVDRAPDNPFENLPIPGLQFARKIGLDNITASLQKAAVDERIKAIYLDLTYINGGMASVEEIRNALKTFKEECDKPIYAYGELFDQKAYYLASVADKLVIHPLGEIDFRGLGGQMTFYKNALDKLGVEMQIVRYGKFKGAVEPFMMDKMSDENREQTQTYLNSLWNHMLKGISEEREIPVDRLNQFADEVLTFTPGMKLVEYGLVDTAKYKDEVLDDLRKITGITGTRGIPVVGVADYARVPVKEAIPPFSRNKIAVIYACGEIGIGLGNMGVDSEILSREIRKVRQDSTYKAMVLRINSPGGSAFYSEIIWREVKLAAEEKILVASFGDMAASGGYYIGCPADTIVASHTTLTGSIGVFGTIPNAGELLNDKLGITFDAVETNEHSNLIPLTRAMTPYERTLFQRYVDESYRTFLTHVSEGRGMEIPQVDSIGEGRVWSGEHALEMGLVDQFGGLKEAIELAAKMAGLDEYRTVSLPRMPDPFEELFRTAPNELRTRWLKKELGENYIHYEQLRKAKQMKGIMARMPYDVEIY
jgi:protease IV